MRRPNPMLPPSLMPSTNGDGRMPDEDRGHLPGDGKRAGGGQAEDTPGGDAPPIPLGELIDRNPNLRPVVIDGLLRVGETMNLISQSKVGKSWAVLDLLLSQATGGSWLGTFGTIAGPVLLLDNELHPETLADRFRKVADARGIDLATIQDRVRVKPLRGKLRNVSELTRLFGEWGIRPGDFSLVVLDAFYRALPPGTEENGNADMARLYGWVDELADTFGCAMALVHHSSKGDQSQKAVTDVGSGAGAMSRATDTHLILRPHEDETAVVLDAAVRSFPPVRSKCLRWEFPLWVPADDLDPTLLGSPTRKRQEQATEARDRKSGTELLTLLDKLDARHDGIGCTRLRKQLGWNPDKYSRVLAGLLRDGILEDVQVDRPGFDDGMEGVRRRTRSGG